MDELFHPTRYDGYKHYASTQKQLILQIYHSGHISREFTKNSLPQYNETPPPMFTWT